MLVPDVLSELQKCLPQERILTGEEITSRIAHVWEPGRSVQAGVVLLPRTTKELSEIMKVCYKHQQSVVVHGGMTNLVDSTRSTKQDLVISMEKMNEIISIDPYGRTIEVQAGVILEEVHQIAEENNLMFPLSYGAKGSAQIGGAISTNAGGWRVLRYGMMRNLVLGLEVVLADGTILSSMKSMLKDNSGYDLKQLFIGAEGTLGIVSKAILKLVELPKSRNSAFVGLQNFEKVLHFLKYMDAGLAGTLSGFELIWPETYQVLSSARIAKAPPIPADYPFYVLLESLGNQQEADFQKLELLLTEAIHQNMIEDAALAYTQADIEWFWKIREDVSPLVEQCQFLQAFDISLPISQIGQVISEIMTALRNLEGVETIYPFGHLADGNIHFLIGKKEGTEALKRQINEIVYHPLKACGGSVSAEHGIGLDKKPYLNISRNSIEIDLMRRIKQTLDPKNILNSGKIFDLPK